jgi:erythronate-4-phosphate dehydrogenase
MKIVADAQIPLIQQAFSNIGDLQLCAGRAITPEIVKDADILLVRSVTPVNASLLHNSRVKFVATATSGTDHVDTGYLQKYGIGFASAHGSNAQSVVEYVLSSLFVLAGQQDFDLRKKTVGIIGHGEVGSCLSKALDAIGVEYLVNDPPLKDETGNVVYVELEDVMKTDIISLHVPLTDAVPYPTRYLIDNKIFAEFKQDAVIINTSRGGVINENALKQHIGRYRNFSTVLDVWEHEPEIDQELLGKIYIGTPHIAGYSTDAKIRATAMIYNETCNYFNFPKNWKLAGGLLDAGIQELKIDMEVNDFDAIAMTVTAHYDVRSDAAALRRVLEIDRGEAGYYFDELRKNYPLRREFSATIIKLPVNRHHLANILSQLGFTVLEQ